MTKPYQVEAGVDGWVVRWRDGTFTGVCPCCDRPMRTEGAARLVAEAFLPGGASDVVEAMRRLITGREGGKGRP